MEFGQRLRDLRRARGLSQKELAAPFFTHAYVSNLESGKRPPTTRVLEHLATKLQVDVEELRTGRPADLEPRLLLELQEARVTLSHGRLEEAQAAFEKIRRKSRRFDLLKTEAKAQAGLGLCAERAGKPEEALEQYERAERLLAEEPFATRVEAIAGQGRCAAMAGDLRYAIHILQSAIDRLEREGQGDPDSLVRLYSPLILCYFEAGLHEKAKEAADEALRLSASIEDPLTLAVMNVNVARTHLHAGSSAEANRVLLQAESLFAQLGLQAERGRARLARGYVLGREEKRDEAQAELTEALRILTASNDTVNQARALKEIGRLQRLSGQTENAVESLQKATTLLTDDSQRGELGLIHRELAFCHLQSDHASAEKHALTSIELLEQSDRTTQAAAVYRLLGDIYTKQGRSPASSEAYRRGLTLLEDTLQL